jgi:hypothetical protein
LLTLQADMKEYLISTYKHVLNGHIFCQVQLVYFGGSQQQYSYPCCYSAPGFSSQKGTVARSSTFAAASIYGSGSDFAVSMTPQDLTWDIFVKDSLVSLRQRKRIQRCH